jgi:beta-arrestin
LGFNNFKLFLFFIHKIFAVQHVDVCMFSNGKFKNIVAETEVTKQISPGETLHSVYSLLPIRGTI